MKMQLANLSACLVAAGLLATGFSAPLTENSISIAARSNTKLVSGSLAEPTHARSVEEDLTYLDRVKPLVVRALHSMHQALAISTVELERRRDPKPAKPLPGKKPAAAPPVKKPASPVKNPIKDPKGKKPETPAKKKPLDLEFTVYPKKKQTWTPPKSKKKGTVRRRSQPAADSQETEPFALERRANIDVREGTFERGTNADLMRTWSVKNCISVAGYDTKTGAKTMAHINGISTQTRKEYGQQFADFANIIYSWEGPVDVWIRWPHKDVIPSDRPDLRQSQDRLEADFRGYISYLQRDAKFKVFSQNAKKHTGDMIMHPSGDVEVDT